MIFILFLAHFFLVVRLSFGPPLAQLEKGAVYPVHICLKQEDAQKKKPQLTHDGSYHLILGLDGIEQVLRKAYDHLTTVRYPRSSPREISSLVLIFFCCLWGLQREDCFTHHNCASERPYCWMYVHSSRDHVSRGSYLGVFFYY